MEPLPVTLTAHVMAFDNSLESDNSGGITIIIGSVARTTTGQRGTTSFGG